MNLKLTWQGHCVRVSMASLHFLMWNLAKVLNQSLASVGEVLYSEALIQNDLCVKK